MKKIFMSLLILCLAHTLLLPSGRIKWTKYSNCASLPIQLAHANSETDFWTYDDHGTFYHFINGNWKTTSLPYGDKNYIYKVCYTGNNNFLVAVIDNNWLTHFYRISNYEWKKFTYIHDLPVQDFGSYKDSLFYAFGNFGSFVVLENDKWKSYKTDIPNHIYSSFAASRDSIWLGTKVDGIYLFDGHSFKNIKIDDDQIRSVTRFIMKNGELFAHTHDGIYYRLVNNIFEKTNYSDTPRKNHHPQKKKIGNTFISLLNKEGEEENYEIPQSFGLNNIRKIDDNKFIASSNNGSIYIGKPSSKTFFYNLSDIYRIKDVNEQYYYSSAIRDMDDDGIPDVLFLSNNPFNPISIYKGSANMPYSLITSTNNVDLTIPNIFMTIGDLDNDYRPDIICGRIDSVGKKISIINIKEGLVFNEDYEYYINPGMQLFGARNVSLFDIDNNGYLDISINYYYGVKDNPGHIEFLKNQYYSNSFDTDTSFNKISRTWLEHVIYGDFDNNNQCDMYLLNRWGKDKFLIQNGGGWVVEDSTRMPGIEYGESEGGCAFDFDNDADLDIFLIERKKFIRAFENNGEGIFKEITDSVFNFNLHSNFKNDFRRTMAIGDLNNDGFQDIYTSVYDYDFQRNYLLLNEAGKKFNDAAVEFLVDQPYTNISSIGDIDNDGDLDILGASLTGSVLWINQLDNNNYLKVKLRGVISNADALFSKIYLYESGHLNDKKFLRGFRQIGSDKYASHQNNDLAAHFGVDEKKRYDIRVIFSSGKEKIVKNVSPGATLNVNELNEFTAFVYSAPRRLYVLVSNQSYRIYSLIIIISTALLLLSTKFGVKKFNWDTKLSVGLSVLHLSVFWMVLLLSSNSSSPWIKYFLPLITIVTVVTIPLIVFKRMSLRNTQSAASIYDELLQLVINFSHGEWALRNLNSLQLLIENIPMEFDGKLLAQFNDRKKTFLELTLPSIDYIISLLKSSDIPETNHADMGACALKLKNLLTRQLRELTDRELKNEIIHCLNSIKNSINKLKPVVFSRYSADPINVVKSITEEYANTFNEHGIDVVRVKEIPEDTFVLIRNYELGDVIDNLIKNAVKSFSPDESKKIILTIRKLPPKIMIEVKNNGRVIEPDLWEKIFERGYSGTNGTGHGLYSVRNMVTKYGGRIYVKQSDKNNGTTFTIELNEGIKNETHDIDN